MTEVTEFVEQITRMRAQRREKIALLPCSTCDFGSTMARECQFSGQDGCKHQEAIEARARVAVRQPAYPALRA